MHRVLRGTAATIRWSKLGQDGEAVAAGAGTVTVYRADGTVLVPATATQEGAANERTFTLTSAHTALLDNLRAVWTDGDSTQETYVEIVGGFLFSLAEARATDASMENPDRAMRDEMLTARAEVEQEFEEICGVAFVPRYRRVALSGPVLPDKRIRVLREVSLDGVLLIPDELLTLSYQNGILAGHRYTSGVVAYEHGYDSPPADVRRAGITRLRSRVFAAKSGIPDRATSFSVTEGGTFRLSTPGEHRTGIPDVDAVLERYQERDVVVA